MCGDEKMLLFSHLAQGYKGLCIQIEADVRNGFPGFDIVGLPDSTIKEARERIRAAIRNSGFKFPAQRILVNLAPADIPKTGAELDAAIAVAILLAGNHNLNLPAAPIMITGELSLSGKIRGNISLSAIESAKSVGCRTILVPSIPSDTSGNICVDCIEIRVIHTLKEALFSALEHIEKHKDTGVIPRASQESKPLSHAPSPYQGIVGMSEARRALEIAAAGRHNILLFGPSGSGKTMIASRLQNLVPPPLPDEAMERQLVLEACRNEPETLAARGTILPHNCTARQLHGDIRTGSPGFGALHHRAVLFLDEITAYEAKTLETIKEIYDEGKTSQKISNGRYITYPAAFQIIATMNACPCGRLGMEKNSCLCSDREIRHFWKKLPAPLLDRFDIRIPIIPEDFKSPSKNNSDGEVLTRIAIAVNHQANRFAECTDCKRNGDIMRSLSQKLHPEITEIVQSLQNMPEASSFSVRGMFSTASVARTIADLDDCTYICDHHLEEAMVLHKYAGTDIFWRLL